MSEIDSSVFKKNAFNFTPKNENVKCVYQEKELQMNELRQVTKPVYDQLNKYFSEINGEAPIFGFPVITFEEEQNDHSLWSLVSQNV